jgi:hypothetical protein
MFGCQVAASSSAAGDNNTDACTAMVLVLDAAVPPRATWSIGFHTGWLQNRMCGGQRNVLVDGKIINVGRYCWCVCNPCLKRQ